MDKKIILTICLMIALLVIPVIANADSVFPDVNGTKYQVPVTKLTSTNIVNGFQESDGTYTFRPNENVTRAQMAKLIVLSCNLKNVTDIALYQFSDVNQSNWFYPYVKTAVDNQIIIGYPEGVFKPDDNVTYAEAITMIVRAMGIQPAAQTGSWASGYITAATREGLLSNVVYTNENIPATRGEVCVALYNLVVKKEADKQKADLEKIEKEMKELEEAKKNPYEFGIVSETSVSKSTYYAKINGIKTKQEIHSLDGSKKLTDSKVEAITNNVIAYKDTDDGLNIDVYYKPSSVDKAKNITSISSNTVTFKDGDKWDLTSSTVKSTYRLYQFIRVTCSYDEDEDNLITFEKVSDLGFGITEVTFAKAERVLIDSTNKIVVIFKGLGVNDTVKNGKVNVDDADTSDYSYGFVTRVGQSGKTSYAKIDRIEYDIASSSDEFEEDTYAVFTEDTKNDTIKLVKSYGVYNLDASAEIVNSVSGKAGEQVIKYKGSSKEVDYYTKSNVSKYRSYKIIVFEIEPTSKGALNVVNHYTEDDLEDITFSTGDRTIVDSKTKVFAIFTGLKKDDVVKKGKYTSAADAEEEAEEIANQKFTVKYAWATGKSLKDVTLPASESVKNGTTYTVKFPTDNRYTYTSNKGTSFKVTSNTTVYITPKAKAAYKVTYELASGSVSGIVTLPKEATVYEGDSYTVQTFKKDGYTITTSPSGKQTIKADLKVVVTVTKSGPTPEEQEVAKRIAELEKQIPTLQKTYNDAKAKSDSASKELSTAESNLSKAEEAYNTASKALTSAKKEKSDLAKEIQSLESAAEKAGEAVEEAQLKIDAAKYRLEHLPEDATAEAKEAAEQEVADAEAENEAAIKEVATANSKLATAKAKVNSVDAKVAEAEEAEQDAKVARADAIVAKDAAAEKAETLLAATEKAKKALDDAQKELADLKK